MAEALLKVPTKEWRKVMKVIESLEEEWINEDEARQLLGSNGKAISQSRIYRMRKEGIIPDDAFKKGVGGNVFYNKRRLIHL